MSEDERGATPIVGVPIVGDRPLADRVLLLERDVQLIAGRLRDGAETFSEHRHALAELTNKWSTEVKAVERRAEAGMEKLQTAIMEQFKEFQAATALQIEKLQPKPMTKLQVVSTAFGILVFAFGVVWAASRYPERREFDGVVKQLGEASFDLRGLARDYKHDIDEVKERIRRLEERKTP